MEDQLTTEHECLDIMKEELYRAFADQFGFQIMSLCPDSLVTYWHSINHLLTLSQIKAQVKTAVTCMQNEV